MPFTPVNQLAQLCYLDSAQLNYHTYLSRPRRDPITTHRNLYFQQQQYKIAPPIRILLRPLTTFESHSRNMQEQIHANAPKPAPKQTHDNIRIGRLVADDPNQKKL